jgi:hypothetical protein
MSTGPGNFSVVREDGCNFPTPRIRVYGTLTFVSGMSLRGPVRRVVLPMVNGLEDQAAIQCFPTCTNERSQSTCEGLQLTKLPVTRSAILIVSTMYEVDHFSETSTFWMRTSISWTLRSHTNDSIRYISSNTGCLPNYARCLSAEELNQMIESSLLLLHSRIRTCISGPARRFSSSNSGR